MTLPLEGRTIALAEGRQLEDLVRMLEAEGATPLRCPLISILDAPDPAPVLAWIDELVADQFAFVILMTGEAIRRLLGFAERAGHREAFQAALGRTRTVVRGPKPIQALRELGITPTRTAQPATTEGVIATLRNEPADALAGNTIGVTLYGEPNPVLEGFLLQAGAQVRTVAPYIYAPATDSDRVAELISRLVQGNVDAIVFTSSPQVDRLYEVATERGLLDLLHQGFEKTRVAAVGPIVAETLRQHGAPVHLEPERGFVMKNLVQILARQL